MEPKLLGSEWYFDDTNIDTLIAYTRQHYPDGLLPREEHPWYADYGSAPFARPIEQLGIQKIPRSEWPERIRRMEQLRARVSDHCDFPCRDQGRTNFCWANGPCAALDMARRVAGLPFEETSAASVACKITGFRNIGGWGIDAIRYLAQHGGVSSRLWPNDAIDRRYDTPDANADRPRRQVVEWWDVPPRDFDWLATLCLLGIPCPVGYIRWAHEVTACDLVEVSPGRFGIRIRNSWGRWGSQNTCGQWGFAVLSESEATPDECLAVRVATPYGASRLDPSSITVGV